MSNDTGKVRRAQSTNVSKQNTHQLEEEEEDDEYRAQ